jgi:hypothetical protein
MVGETLRCAQGDSGGAAFIVQIHLLKFIIGCGRDQSAITGGRGRVFHGIIGHYGWWEYLMGSQPAATKRSDVSDAK